MGSQREFLLVLRRGWSPYEVLLAFGTGKVVNSSLTVQI